MDCLDGRPRPATLGSSGMVVDDDWITVDARHVPPRHGPRVMGETRRMKRYVSSKTIRGKLVEAFGIIGMTFGTTGMALGVFSLMRLAKLEKRLKESGVLGKDYPTLPI